MCSMEAGPPLYLPTRCSLKKTELSILKCRNFSRLQIGWKEGAGCQKEHLGLIMHKII